MKFRIMGSALNVVKIWKKHSSKAVLSAIFLVVLIPSLVHAGITSFIFSLFAGEKVQAEVTTPNSQNMQLLEAKISPLPFSTTTSKELSIVDATSLISDGQPTSGDYKNFDDERISVYVVHEGDTLPAIARMFQVSVNTIRWANDIKSKGVSVGQTLVILPISGVKHLVKKGETIQGITKLHGGSLVEVLIYNNLTKDSKLAIGDEIIIPDGEIVETRPTTSSANSSRPSYNGYYMKPIVGGVKTQGIHGRNGVDLASSYGSNILASADGEVIIARSGWNGGYGTYIVVKHANGTQTLYAHLSSLLVSAGQSVSQGQVIGRMGSTGKSTGVHLHFEVRGARNPF